MKLSRLAAATNLPVLRGLPAPDYSVSGHSVSELQGTDTDRVQKERIRQAGVYDRVFVCTFAFKANTKKERCLAATRDMKIIWQPDKFIHPVVSQGHVNFFEIEYQPAAEFCRAEVNSGDAAGQCVKIVHPFNACFLMLVFAAGIDADFNYVADISLHQRVSQPAIGIPIRMSMYIGKRVTEG